MAFLGGTYNADPDNVQGDYTPIPAGEYRVHVVESEMKDNKAGTGQYLVLQMEVLDGQHSGRKLTDRLNLDNPNTQAVEIAQRTLNAICVAVSKLSISDSTELHNIPMIAVVKVDPPRGEYGASNSVRTYKPAGGATGAVGGFKPAAGNSNSNAPWKRAG